MRKMAEPSAKSVLGTISRGHLECPICCCRFTAPKTLDCLHNFCLKCLDDLISGQPPGAGEISCPVCRRGTRVPDNGLQGLPNSFFLIALIDEFNKQERLLGNAQASTRACEECGKGLDINRCLDCDGNISQKSLDVHRKTKCTHQKHRIVGSDQSRRKVSHPKRDIPRCNKHPNQEHCFYCETCKTLACGKCAALDHRTAEHEYTDISDAVQSYRQDVGEILQKFDESREEFKAADNSLTHARNRLRVMVARACEDITAKEKEEIAKIRDKSRQLRDKVKQIGEERDKKFGEVQQSNRAKMEQSEHIVAAVNNLMQRADDCELLDLKPKVMHNLEFQKELAFERAQHELSFVGVKCHSVVRDTDIGEVLQEEKWQLKQVFGEDGDGDGQFQYAIDVSSLSSGDIVVTDFKKQQLTKFTSSGKYITSSQENLNEPTGVAATSDDLLLVTDGDQVKVFDSSLKFIRQFTPSQLEAGDASESRLTGIAVDKEDRVAVAHEWRKLITVHRLDGSLIATNPQNLSPSLIAIGVGDRLIFTNFDEQKMVCTTYTGDEVFNINTLLNGQPVEPHGVCCDNAGDIYVSVAEEPLFSEGSEGSKDSESSEVAESDEGSEGSDSDEDAEGGDRTEGSESGEGSEGSESGEKAERGEGGTSSSLSLSSSSSSSGGGSEVVRLGYEDPEVHHYSRDGVFIESLASRLDCPFGLTFTPRGDLVAADRYSVKIFQRV